MFERIKRIFNNKVSTKTVSDYDFITSDSTTTSYKRDKCGQNVLARLNGYQYIAGDIVSKTIAGQNLRLYQKVSSRNSKFYNRPEEIFTKHVKVNRHIQKYLRGEGEICHDSIRIKALTADLGVVEVLEHPVLDLLNSPNDYSSKFDFFYSLSLAMQFYGNSFYEILKNGEGIPSELWYVPPQYMEIIQGTTTQNFITNYKWGECIGVEKNIDFEDMLDFKIPGIGNSQVYGMSKLEVAWKYINLLDGSLAFQQAIVNNTGRPDMVILAEDTAASADELANLERKFNDRFFGPTQAGKNAGVLRGKVKIEVIDRVDFDFDNDTSLIRAIARAYGLPEYKVLPSSAIKANDSTQEKDFMKETINSYLTLIEEVLNQSLLSQYPNSEDLFFAYDPVIKEDIEFKLKEQLGKVAGGIWEPNIVREQDGLEAHEDGDTLKASSSNNTEVTTPTPQGDTDKALKQEVLDIVATALKEFKPVQQAPVSPGITLNIGGEVEVVEEVENSEE